MSIKAFRLLDSELTFLEEGEAPDGYRNHEMEERIEEKIDLLDERLTRLLADVESLSESDEWSVDTWGDAWFRLIGADSIDGDLKDAYQYNIGELIQIADDEYIRGGSLVAHFGKRLGALANTLLLHHRELDLDQVRADLVWGFCMGISSGSFPHGYEFAFRTGKLIQERAKEEGEYFQDVLSDVWSFDGMRERDELVQRRIREILSDQFEADVPDWAVNDVKQGFSEDRGERWYMSLSDSQEAVNDALSREEIMDIIDEKKVAEKSELLSAFGNNISKLESIERDGLNARAILVEISSIPDSIVDPSKNSREEGGKRQVRDVAGCLAGSEKSPAVAKICRLLAGVDDMDGMAWDKPPLIVINQDAEDLFDWTVETTKFGELFAQFVYAPNEASESVAYIFDPLGPTQPDDVRIAHRELTEYNHA